MIILSKLAACLAVAHALWIPTAWSPAQQPVFTVDIWKNGAASSLKLKPWKVESPEFDAWLAVQSNRSFEYILENIGGISTTLAASEVAPGIVIASPSRHEPNYFYNWVRDSALTMRTLLYHMNDNVDDFSTIERLKPVLELYIEANYKLQRIPNKSGVFDDERRSGLGEPKFLPSGDAFNEVWGRPQADGPGLRVSTILGYLYFLQRHGLEIENKSLGSPADIYFNIVKPDLEYVIANWRFKSFDLWEEVNSQHFFNALTQLKALQDGQRFALFNGLDVPFAKKLQETFDEVYEFVTESGRFTRQSLPYIVNTPELYEKGVRSGLDGATFLAALHAHNLEFGGTDNIPFDVDDSHILNTITAMVADMKSRYLINRDYAWRSDHGAALGRYPEDIYDGAGTSLGNPWFISTLSASEVLYKWIYKYTIRHADLIIDDSNFAFFRPHDPELRKESPDSGMKIVIPFNSYRYQSLLRNVYKYADSFLAVVRRHVNTIDGTMSEQFDRSTGFMRGAESLTWSYSAFHNCVRWREKAAAQLEVLSYE